MFIDNRVKIQFNISIIKFFLTCLVKAYMYFINYLLHKKLNNALLKSLHMNAKATARLTGL